MGDTFTIQISSDLIRQLNSDLAKPKKSIKVKPKSSQEQQHKPQSKTNPASTAENDRSPGIWPYQPQTFLPLTRSPHSPIYAELEAIRASLQESERVVEKLEKQEANMIQQLTDRAKELHEKEFKLPYQKPLPCSSEREACLQCYKEHLNDPLKCASVVQNFANCARQARQQAQQHVGTEDGNYRP